MSEVVNYTPKYFVQAENVHEELRRHMLVDGFDFVLDTEKSENAYFVEARTGKRFLDFFTCFASMPIGMNHPKLNNEDYINYIGKIALNKPSNSDIYTEVMATFVKTFHSVADLDKFKYSFYISGGALAVENALKAAFDWKARKNLAKGISGEKGSRIIHFRQAFHGRTGYTMSLTNTDPNKVAFFPKFEWPRIINPKITHPLDKNLESVIKTEDQASEEIKKAFADHPDDIAAIIIEPIQGEGGDNHFRPEFMRQLRKLADENEALLIYDEVQTGVGITGKWWAHQHTDVVPDIMAFGKKMQVCGIVATGRLDEVEDNVFHKSGRINSTWGGNLTDMARSTKYMEIIDEENLVMNAAERGKYLMNQLIAVRNEFNDRISNVRGKGVFCAFDLPDAGTRNKFRNDCFNEGLLILACGERSIRFRPPLNITDEQIDEGFHIIRKALKRS